MVLINGKGDKKDFKCTEILRQHSAFENLKSSETKADEILDKQTLYQRAKNRKYL